LPEAAAEVPRAEVGKGAVCVCAVAEFFTESKICPPSRKKIWRENLFLSLVQN
jgi:hypothetical protein